MDKTQDTTLATTLDTPLLTVPLPDGYAPLRAQVLAQLGDSLGALLLLGSCLSASTRQPDSVPDLLAIVEDVDAALMRLGGGRLTRALARWLPPLTLALRGPARDGTQRTVAKLNLIEMSAAQRAVAELPDLYVAGRLSKPTAWLWRRDAGWQERTESLLTGAVQAIADLTLRGLAGRHAHEITAVERLYIGQSYLAEPRPEGEAKWRSLRDAFPSFYAQRARSVLVARAPALGLRVIPLPTVASPAGVALLDDRSDAQRDADHALRARLLRRSRLRTLARWPKMMLVYRGWLTYLIGKLLRVRRQQRAAGP